MEKKMKKVKKKQPKTAVRQNVCIYCHNIICQAKFRTSYVHTHDIVFTIQVTSIKGCVERQHGEGGNVLVF